MFKQDDKKLQHQSCLLATALTSPITIPHVSYQHLLQHETILDKVYLNATLTQFCLSAYKMDIIKQCITRSDATEHIV